MFIRTENEKYMYAIKQRSTDSKFIENQPSHLSLNIYWPKLKQCINTSISGHFYCKKKGKGWIINRSELGRIRIWVVSQRPDLEPVFLDDLIRRFGFFSSLRSDPDPVVLDSKCKFLKLRVARRSTYPGRARQCPSSRGPAWRRWRSPPPPGGAYPS